MLFVCAALDSAFRQLVCVCVEVECRCPLTGRDAPAAQTFDTQENGEAHGSSGPDAASRCC